MSHEYLRRTLVTGWLAVMAGAFYLFFYHPEILHRQLETATSFSLVAAAALYLFFGCLRGFTLIPTTALVVAAIPFFPPGRLFGLTMLGILISAASVYMFSEALHLEELIGSQNQDRMTQLKAALQRHELPVIIGWSFFPLAPTDLICYVCGVLQLDFRKCLLGVGIGEGLICAIYIFLGDYLLRMLRFRA